MPYDTLGELEAKSRRLGITPVTYYSLGRSVVGTTGDETEDKWTNRGYSATGPNLTYGMAAVNPRVHPIGTVFRDRNTGEKFIAGDKHGNRDPNVVDIYVPPAVYPAASRTWPAQRDLEVIGRVEPGKTPEAVRAQLGQIDDREREQVQKNFDKFMRRQLRARFKERFGDNKQKEESQYGADQNAEPQDVVRPAIPANRLSEDEMRGIREKVAAGESDVQKQTEAQKPEAMPPITMRGYGSDGKITEETYAPTRALQREMSLLGGKLKAVMKCMESAGSS